MNTVVDPSDERNSLLERIANILQETCKDGKKKGLDDVLQEIDLEAEYDKGLLRNSDMDWFLLELLNEDEDEKDHTCPLKTMIGALSKRRNGKEIDINPLASILLGKNSSPNETIVTPFDKMQALVKWLREAKGHPEVLEGDGSGMKYRKTPFENWGLTVKTNNLLTFVPTTKIGLCNLVKWAKTKNLKVRAAGYRHSWSDITVNNDQVLVSMLPIPKAENIPSLATEIDENNELQGVTLLEDTITEDGVEKRLCKIGAATTNEQFRKWVVRNAFNEKTETWGDWWTIPLNVILVEITFGGSNAPICHGSGIKTKTLSDLVAAIEFVNANGELQVVDDPEQLKSAAGSIGMTGVVTSITMKLDPLTYARMVPLKKKLALTIPPPAGFDVPDGIDMKGVTEEARAEAFKEFVDRCENDYYVEYFWFPLQKKCWINNWKNNGNPADAEDYPSPAKARNQAISIFLSGVLNSTIWPRLPGRFQVKVTSAFAMLVLPERTEENPIVTPLIDALHFQRGIHNMRVRDMEWEIPIPGLKSDPSKPDWSVAQKAWWAAIKIFYQRYNKSNSDVPMRMPLEMRITGDSNIHLAPQNGNTHGTCSIEVLTTQNVDNDEWQGYMQEVADAWTNLMDDSEKPIHPFKNENGMMLHPRPHWAKDWANLTVKGVPIRKYCKETACTEQIKLYQSGLEEIAKSGGYTVEEADKVFSTELSRDMFSK